MRSEGHMSPSCASLRSRFELPPLPVMATSPDVSHVLLPLGGLVGREVDLDAFLQTLMDRIAVTMQADRGTLWLLDPARGDLFSRAAHLPEVSQIRVKRGQGVAGSVAESGEPVNMPDPRGESRFYADIDRMTGYRTTTILAVPLRDAGGTLYGVLQVLNRRGGAGACTRSCSAPRSSPRRPWATSSTASSASPNRSRSSTGSSRRRRPRTPRCCCEARAGVARSCSPGRCTSMG